MNQESPQTLPTVPQTIQVNVPPQSFPTQGEGAIIAGALVAIGVWATLTVNGRRERASQLRKRASDRETALQKAYATFLGAGFGQLNNAIHLSQMHDSIKAAAKRNAAEELNELMKQMDEDVKTAIANIGVLQQSFAQVMLVEDSEERRLQATRLFEELVHTDFDYTFAVRIWLMKLLLTFAREVGTNIIKEYNHADDQAAGGERPNRRPVNPDRGKPKGEADTFDDLILSPPEIPTRPTAKAPPEKPS